MTNLKKFYETITNYTSTERIVNVALDKIIIFLILKSFGSNSGRHRRLFHLEKPQANELAKEYKEPWRH